MADGQNNGGRILDIARGEGALNAKMDIVLEQAEQLFSLHRELLKDGLPQCVASEKRQIAVENRLTVLEKAMIRVALGLTICMCALFGAEKIAKWFTTGISPSTEEQGEYTMDHRGGRGK